MADTTTTRPKPRPRPKPVAKRSSHGAFAGTPGAPSSSSTTEPLAITNKQRVIDDNDVDQMFIRNTHRTYETWQRLDKIDRASHKEKKESSDSDDATSPRKGNKNKRKKPAVTHSQPWQNPKELTRLLSEDLSDSDIEILGEPSSPNGKPQGKRKRKQRSRSRSITPPPAVSLANIESARNFIRETLRVSPRAESPTFDPDESSGTIIYQPELRAIAQEIKDQTERFGSQAPEPAADDSVAVKVKWHPHPLAQAPPKPVWEFEMGRADTFRDLFEAVSEEAEIQSSNLILTHQGNRIFPSITPHNLQIWTDSFALEAYEKSAYEYIHTNAMANLRSAPQTSTSTTVTSSAVIDIDSDSDSDSPNEYSRPATTMSPPPAHNTQTQPHESDAESEAEGEKFKITLRSSVGKDVTLTVRRTTKCGAILKAFLKKVGVADQYPEVFMDKVAVAPPPPPPAAKKRGRKSKADIAAAAAAAALAAVARPGPVKDPRLCIEGTKMDNNEVIGDEAEDGDMIDVVGL